MAYNNIDAEVPDADKEAFKNNLIAAMILLPFLVNLTIDERRRLIKIGNNRYTFVKRFIQIAENNASEFPVSFNLAGLKKDFELFDDLKDLIIPMVQDLEKLTDTQKAVGNEALTKALQGKQMLEAANRTNAGLDDVVAELREFFDRTPQDDEPGTTPIA